MAAGSSIVDQALAQLPDTQPMVWPSASSSFASSASGFVYSLWLPGFVSKSTWERFSVAIDGSSSSSWCFWFVADKLVTRFQTVAADRIHLVSTMFAAVFESKTASEAGIRPTFTTCRSGASCYALSTCFFQSIVGCRISVRVPIGFGNAIVYSGSDCLNRYGTLLPDMELISSRFGRTLKVHKAI